MKPKNFNSRSHRRTRAIGLSVPALLVLLFAGSGTALAGDRRDDRESYREHDRYEERRASSNHRNYRDHDRHRDDHRYDRHRNDHRYDRHRGHNRRHQSCDVRRHDHRYGHHHRYDRHRHFDRYRHHNRYNRHRYDHHRYNRHRYNHHHYRSFDIPKVILHELLHTYSAYRHGRLYHAKHRHYHEIYRFPVYSEYGVEYYPYAYCEGNFFGRGIFRNGRPVFDIHISF